MAWRKLEFPSWTCERMIGFSLPVAGRLVLVCYCGIVSMDLANPAAWTLDDSETAWEGGTGYDQTTQTLQYRGAIYRLLGLYGGEPIQRSGAGEEAELTAPVVIDTTGGRYMRSLTIRDRSGAVSFRVDFEELSGDWGFATFTSDGNYVIAGMPYDLFVVAREQHEG